MRKLIIPVAAAAALAFVALDAAPAKAQVIITSGYYSPGYYPYPYGSGLVIGGGGINFGAYPAYSGYPGYGYRPSYGGGYSPYNGGGYSPYHGGGHPAYYGSGHPGYPGGYRGGWRR